MRSNKRSFVNCFVLISDAKVYTFRNMCKYFSKKMMQNCKHLIYIKKCK